MNITINTIKSLCFAFLLFSFSAHSETVRKDLSETVSLTDVSEIIGKWKLDGTARCQDCPQRPAKTDWEFGSDGTLTTSSYDSRLPGGHFTVTVPFNIENGLIQVENPGRSGPSKYTKYIVTNKDGNKMTLTPSIGEFNFFTKQ